MALIESLEFQCVHCTKFFLSPFAFGDTESFEGTDLQGNATRCPYCRRDTPCNKENFRLRADGQGFLGTNIKF